MKSSSWLSCRVFGDAFIGAAVSFYVFGMTGL
jgi:hypothetical protein